MNLARLAKAIEDHGAHVVKATITFEQTVAAKVEAEAKAVSPEVEAMIDQFAADVEGMTAKVRAMYEAHVDASEPAVVSSAPQVL